MVDGEDLSTGVYRFPISRVRVLVFQGRSSSQFRSGGGGEGDAIEITVCGRCCGPPVDLLGSGGSRGFSTMRFLSPPLIRPTKNGD